MKLPLLRDCEPYRVRLTLEGCVKRYLIANDPEGYKKPKDQARYSVKDRFRLCVGCLHGKVRTKLAPHLEPDPVLNRFNPSFIPSNQPPKYPRPEPKEVEECLPIQSVSTPDEKP